MDELPEIVLDGDSLTLDEIVRLGSGQVHVALDPQALARVQRSRALLEDAVAAGQIIYGVNTSFGPMANKILAPTELEALQRNLVHSHAAGMGEPLSPEVSRATLAIRLNTLVKGNSGVRPLLLEYLVAVLNAGIAPWLPESGSVGASGDLVHLAHLGLLVMGEGRAWKGKTPGLARDFLQDAGIEPVVLSYKEGLALMNGTAAMTALGVFAWQASRRILRWSCVTAAFGAELFHALEDAFDEDLHRLKPHPGQVAVAAELRRLLDGSKRISRRDELSASIRNEAREGAVYETVRVVQDVYSIRCTPQILAPVWETLENIERTLTIEANSSNDNPLIPGNDGKILHGGNFHGMSVALAMDHLALALACAANLSERRLNKLLDRSLNQGLPENLVSGVAGLRMGFMGAQYLATSSTAEVRQLAGPSSVHLISCNESNQDVVSMGTLAARKALKSARTCEYVVALELLADLQALTPQVGGLGRGTAWFFEQLSPSFTLYDDQRPFYQDLEPWCQALFAGPAAEALDRWFS